MAKFRAVANEEGRYNFNCPGCGFAHGVWTKTENPLTHARWDFNGDVNNPTVSPSILVRGYDGEKEQNYVCHSFIKAGKIQFLGDCTHALAGQTVELPEF